MDEPNKLWVIDLGDQCVAEEPHVKQPEIRRSPPRLITPVNRTIPKAPVRRVAQPSGNLHFATKMALSYLLGPFALLMWARDRKKPSWSFIAMFSGIGSIVLAWKWRAILAHGSSGSLLIPLVVLAGLLSLLAFTSWAKALHLAFASRTRSHTSWPAWMRSSWAVTSLGFLAPGLGLYLAGSYRRAVAAVWAFWPVFLAGVILAHAGWTWQWLRNSLHTPGSEEMFENLVMASVAVLILGCGGWLVQALMGLHRQTQLSRSVSGAHGDRYAVALLMAVVALAVLSPPADMASLVNEAGIRLHQEGFQLIPLQLTRSAHALDPGETSYSLQLAALHRERGEDEEADTVQRALDNDLQVYFGMLGRQVAETKPQPVARNIQQNIQQKPESKKPEPAVVPEVGSWTRPLSYGPKLDSWQKQDTQ